MTNAWVREDEHNRTIVFLENKETSKRYFWNTLLRRFTTLCFAIVVLLSLLNTRSENSDLKNQINNVSKEQTCRSAAVANVEAKDARVDYLLSEGLLLIAQNLPIIGVAEELAVANEDLRQAIEHRERSLTDCLVD